MARWMLLVAALLMASPVFAQSRVYTNDDLLVRQPRIVDAITPDQLRVLAEHQFVLLPIYERPDYQVVYGGYSDRPVAHLDSPWINSSNVWGVAPYGSGLLAPIWPASLPYAVQPFPYGAQPLRRLDERRPQSSPTHTRDVPARAPAPVPVTRRPLSIRAPRP